MNAITKDVNGTKVSVIAEKNGKASDEKTIIIDFSGSSFPEIEIIPIRGRKKIKIHSFGSIEQTEIVQALESALIMLKS